MCIKKIPTFGVCKYSGASNPDLTYIETHGCPTKVCQSPREVTEYRKDEKCFDCVGVEPFQQRRDRPAVFFKHCFQSEICDHEFEHFLTEIERDPFEPEFILITPIPYAICPDRKSNGYDNRPGGSNPSPRTASVLPRDFEDLPRAIMATIMASTSMKPSPSRVSMGTYNLSTPQSGTLARATESSTARLSASRAPMASKVPSSSVTPPHQTTHRPSVAASTYKSLSAISNARSRHDQAGHECARPPKTRTSKNVAASAFYDSPDGREARANAIPSYRVLRAGTTRPSPFESRTQSPPADAPSLALEEKLGGVTLSPKSVRSLSSEQPSGSTQRPNDQPSSSTIRPSEQSATQLSRNLVRHSMYTSHNHMSPYNIPRLTVTPPKPRPSVPPASSKVPSHPKSTIHSSSRPSSLHLLAPRQSAVPASSKPSSATSRPANTAKSERKGKVSTIPGKNNR